MRRGQVEIAGRMHRRFGETEHSVLSGGRIERNKSFCRAMTLAGQPMPRFPANVETKRQPLATKYGRNEMQGRLLYVAATVLTLGGIGAVAARFSIAADPAKTSATKSATTTASTAPATPFRKNVKV